MFSALPTLAVLATLAALGSTGSTGSPGGALEPYYVTFLHKGVSWAELNENIGPLFIPDGQCSGVLDHADEGRARALLQLLRCEDGGAPLGVRVNVQDSAMARVALDPGLLRASVLRAYCAGEAQVDLRLACAR